jgi:hypothetical protein
MPIRIFNLLPSAIACLMRSTEESLKNCAPAGIICGFEIAATSQISARLMPLDFLASRSRVMDSLVMLPLSQHQKEPGLDSSGGLTKFSSERLSIG